jgi:hypothetical protein
MSKSAPAQRTRIAPALSPAYENAVWCARYRMWRVHPVWGLNADGYCQCAAGRECKSAGKHPIPHDWPAEASTNLAKLKAWNRELPGANWGLACGAPPVGYDTIPGVVGFDVDPDRGGADSLRALVAKRKHKLPPCPGVNTGGGGIHLLFLHPGRDWYIKTDTDVLGPGLDVRGDGGQLVGVGSRHYLGKGYAWDPNAHPANVQLAEIPPDLLEIVGRRVTERTECTDEDRVDGREYSVDSVDSVHSVTFSSLHPHPNSVSKKTPTKAPAPARGTAAPSCDPVAIAIASTIPEGHGQRHRGVFNFARHLRAMDECRELTLEKDRDALMVIVRRWHEAALPFIRTQDFPATWADFCGSWPKIRFAAGEGSLDDAIAAADAAPEPPECEPYKECLRTCRMIRLCRELQRMAGADPFFISCDTARRVLGFDSKMTASRYLKMLIAGGILAVVKVHTRKTATRYRYLPPFDA